MRSTATKAPVGLWLARGSQWLGMSTVVAAAAMRKGVFNLTRTGIAAELTAASGGNREAKLGPWSAGCERSEQTDEGYSRENPTVLRPHQSPAVTAAPLFVTCGDISPRRGENLSLPGEAFRGKWISLRRRAFILNTTCHFMDKKPGRGTRSGALLPGFSAFFPQISGLK